MSKEDKAKITSWVGGWYRTTSCIF